MCYLISMPGWYTRVCGCAVLFLKGVHICIYRKHENKTEENVK